MHRLTLILALTLSLALARSTCAAVMASGGGGPSTTTTYNGTRIDGFVVVEGVAYDAGAGVWQKELVNVGSGPGNMLASGVPAAIDETFTNVGLIAWTDWHEQVLSRTTVDGDSNYPGFLFRDGSLGVYRNGGLLTEGSDYVLTTQSIFNQLSPNGDWEAMAITFSSGAMIQPGDSLRVTKDIFEVFGDGDVWQLNEAAVLAQYPSVPEPASISLALLGVGAALSRRLWRHWRQKVPEWPPGKSFSLRSQLVSRGIACRLHFCAFLLLAIAILFPASTVQAVTVYMSSNSDDINQYTPPGPVSNFAHLPFGTTPEGLAFDTLGNLFVAGNAGVSKITPGGMVSDFATLPTGGYGMAIDVGNNLYVSAGSGHEISKITPGGTVSSFATLDGSFDPTGLTFDTLGNLYVAAGNTIREITSGGAVSTYATLTSHVNTYGLAFDSAGYLYVSDITSTTLLKIPPGGGSFSDFATTLSSGPEGLVFDGGILYAAQPNEDKISTITLAGTATTFGVALNGPRYLAVQPASVPEPSSIVMLGLGLILIGSLATVRLRRGQGNAPC